MQHDFPAQTAVSATLVVGCGVSVALLQDSPVPGLPSQLVPVGIAVVAGIVAAAGPMAVGIARGWPALTAAAAALAGPAGIAGAALGASIGRVAGARGHGEGWREAGAVATAGLATAWAADAIFRGVPTHVAVHGLTAWAGTTFIALALARPLGIRAPRRLQRDAVGALWTAPLGWLLAEAWLGLDRPAALTSWVLVAAALTVVEIRRRPAAADPERLAAAVWVELSLDLERADGDRARREALGRALAKLAPTSPIEMRGCDAAGARWQSVYRRDRHGRVSRKVREAEPPGSDWLIPSNNGTPVALAVRVGDSPPDRRTRRAIAATLQHAAPRLVPPASVSPSGFRDRLEGEIDRARRYGARFAVAVIDGTDGPTLAARLDAAARRSDVVGALGENRCALVLLQVDPDSALRVVQRLVGSAGELRLGLATFPGDGDAAEQLIQAAEARLASREPSSGADGPRVAPQSGG